MSNFEIIEYVVTPGEKQKAYFICRYHGMIVPFVVKDMKEKGIFITGLSFKPSETGSWIKTEFDSRIENNFIMAQLQAMIKSNPTGYSQNSQYAGAQSAFAAPPTQGSQRNLSSAPAQSTLPFDVPAPAAPNNDECPF